MCCRLSFRRSTQSPGTMRVNSLFAATPMALWPHGMYEPPPSLHRSSHHMVGTVTYTPLYLPTHTQAYWMEASYVYKTYYIAQCPSSLTGVTKSSWVMQHGHVYSSILFEHSFNTWPLLGKQPKDGKKPEPCKPILKVEYKTTRAGWVWWEQVPTLPVS